MMYTIYDLRKELHSEPVMNYISELRKRGLSMQEIGTWITGEKERLLGLMAATAVGGDIGDVPSRLHDIRQLREYWNRETRNKH